MNQQQTGIIYDPVPKSFISAKKASELISLESAPKLNCFDFASATDSADFSEKLNAQKKLGYHINERAYSALKPGVNFYAQDVAPTNGFIQAPNTIPSIGVPVQFTQFWDPGFILNITKARKGDALVGRSVVGDQWDNQVVLTQLEVSGSPAPYQDYSNYNLTGQNLNFGYMSIVRFALGLQSFLQEEETYAKMKQNVTANKRLGVMRGLAILRNQICFYGYNNGLNTTTGILNDPSLPAPVTLAPGVSGYSNWNNKTFIEIINDIIFLTSTLLVQSGSNIDPNKDEIILAIPSSFKQALDRPAEQPGIGISVNEWINKTYKNCRVEYSPEFTDGISGLNAVYCYADHIKDDGSTDGGKTWLQAVPSEFFTIGVKPEINGFIELDGMATAGTKAKRPMLIVVATADNGPGFSNSKGTQASTDEKQNLSILDAA